MHWFTMLFLFAVVASAALRIWLANRQIHAAAAHSEQVPEPFSEQVSLTDHRKAAEYTIARMRLSRIDTLIDAAVTIALTVGGGIAAFDTLWRARGWQEPWLGLAVIGTTAAVMALVNLPLSLWRTFGIEAKFGFNRTTPRLYLADLLKGLSLSVLIGGLVLLATLELMLHTGRWWWACVWGVWLAVSLLMTWAWPAFIAPLFNRFLPLQDAMLKTRIESLLERCGFHSSGVFVMDGSRRSSHGNAYFTGLGRHKRIVFFDTLLQQLGPAEVEAVLAHELGHFRLKHIRQRLLLSAAIMLVGLGLFGLLAARAWFYTALGVPRPSIHSALLLLALVAPVFTFFATPIGALWSRQHEFEADGFAARYANAGELAAALVKLYRDNASTLTPDRLYAAFYYSHPPALERILRLRTAG
jgi:STE24 endopeptidase